MARIKQLLRMSRLAAVGVLTVGCNALLDNEEHSLAGPKDAAVAVEERDGAVEERDGAVEERDGAIEERDGARPSGDASSRVEGGDAACVGDCAPNMVETGTQACGACSKGMQSRTRTCTAGCIWGAWSNWGTCSISVDCQPGSPAQSQSVACGNCGTKTQSRTCSSTCTWGAWTDSSACNDLPDCDICAHVQYCTDPDTGGTTCQQDACTRAQALADCMTDIPIVCGATKQPFTMKYQ